MDELLKEITAYAKARGWKPERVLREGIGAGWGEWAAWQSGASSPTMARVDRLRRFMAANPSKVAKVAAGEVA